MERGEEGRREYRASQGSGGGERETEKHLSSGGEEERGRRSSGERGERGEGDEAANEDMGVVCISRFVLLDVSGGGCLRRMLALCG